MWQQHRRKIENRVRNPDGTDAVCVEAVHVTKVGHWTKVLLTQPDILPILFFALCAFNKVKKELSTATCPRPKGKGLAHITQFF